MREERIKTGAQASGVGQPILPGETILFLTLIQSVVRGPRQKGKRQPWNSGGAAGGVAGEN